VDNSTVQSKTVLTLIHNNFKLFTNRRKYVQITLKQMAAAFSYMSICSQSHCSAAKRLAWVIPHKKQNISDV